MKIAHLSTNGIEPVIAKAIPPTREGGSSFYSIMHGMTAKDCWEIRIPISSTDVAVTDNKPFIDTSRLDFDLVVLEHRRDIHRNPGLLLRTSQADKSFLLLWDLTPGFGGKSIYKVEGDATVVARGYINADETNKLRTEAPVVRVNGPCKLKWYRGGNVHGQQRAWQAVYDGERWTITPMMEDWLDVVEDIGNTEMEEEDAA